MKQLLLIALMAHGAAAAEGTLTVGVLLPTTIQGGGSARFAFGESLAAALAKETGRKPQALNYARIADFRAAAQMGKLDVAVVDAWIAAESLEKYTPIAQATMAGESKQRWALVGSTGRSVADLAGKRVVVLTGDAFLTNAIFEGDLPAAKHFKLQTAPDVDSALRLLDAGSADAALIPAAHVPPGKRVIYRSAPIAIAVVLAMKSGPDLGPALARIKLAPFDGFQPASPDSLAALRRLIQKGPPPRVPILSESLPLHFDGRSLVTFRGAKMSYPAFVDLMGVPEEQPED
jgi:ABC-type amino acid transport substrate-binding protein